MVLEAFDGVELAAPADFHVHLRDGPMMELVTRTVRKGGVNTVFVMVSGRAASQILRDQVSQSIAESGSPYLHSQAGIGLQRAAASDRA